jgi:hypothetical protein
MPAVNASGKEATTVGASGSLMGRKTQSVKLKVIKPMKEPKTSGRSVASVSAELAKKYATTRHSVTNPNRN